MKRQSRRKMVSGDVFFTVLLTWASFLASCSSTFRLSSLLPYTGKVNSKAILLKTEDSNTRYSNQQGILEALLQWRP